MPKQRPRAIARPGPRQVTKNTASPIRKFPATRKSLELERSRFTPGAFVLVVLFCSTAARRFGHLMRRVISLEIFRALVMPTRHVRARDEP